MRRLKALEREWRTTPPSRLLLLFIAKVLGFNPAEPPAPAEALPGPQELVARASAYGLAVVGGPPMKR